jgi:hypothetical protein
MSIVPLASAARMRLRAASGGERRRAVDVLREDARASEFVADVDAVSDIDRKDDGPPCLGETMPMLDNVTDELGGVDASGELAFDIVASRNLDAPQIRPGRCIDPRWNKEALAGQFSD